MRNSWKRVAAGALALALVAGMTPANVGGFLSKNTSIVASAQDEETMQDVIALTGNTNEGTNATISGTYVNTVDTSEHNISGLKMCNATNKISTLHISVTNNTLKISKIVLDVAGIGDKDVFSPGIDKENISIEGGTGTVTDDTGDEKIVIENIEGDDFDIAVVNPPTGAISLARTLYISKATIDYAEKDTKTKLTATDFTVAAPESGVYDGTAKGVTVTPATGYENVQYTISYTNAQTGATVTNPTDVGTYHPVITVVEDDTYASVALTDNAHWDFSITQADNAVTNETAIADQKLNDLANFVKVQPKFGNADDVQYSLDGTNWSTDVPAIPNRSENLPVYYKLAGTSNYTELTGSFNVTYRTSLLDSESVAESANNDKASYRLSNSALMEGHPSLDVRGKSGNNNIQVTYHDGGFGTYMSVAGGGNSQVGKTLGQVDKIGDIEVKLVPSVTKSAQGVVLTYTIANVGFETKNVRIGSCGDTMLNGNDACSVTYTSGEPAITMTNGATVFFVNAQAGSEDGFRRWVGNWSGEIANVFNDANVYSSGDSAVAWSWNVNLAGGEIRTFEVLLSATCTPVVTYHLNYPNCPTLEKSTMEYMGQTLTVADPHRAGYDFEKWTYMKAGEVTVDKDSGEVTNAPNSTQVFTSGSPVNYSMDLIANWKKHEYRYTVDNNGLTSKITAHCTNSVHPTDTNDATLTLSIPSATKNYDGSAFTATFAQTKDFVEEIEAVTGDTIQIMYEGVGDTNYPATTVAPTKAGNYRAFIKISDKTGDSATELVTAERKFSILEEFDLNDDHSNDPLVRKNDNVRNAIRSISIDANGNGRFEANEKTAFDDTTDADHYYYWKQGDKVQIKSIAKLVFTTDEGTIDAVETSSSSEGCYTYDFTVPYGVNIVTVKRVYNYSFRNEDAKSFGKNDFAFPKEEYQVAELIAEDYEYLDKLDNHIKFNVTDDFELRYSVNYTYTKDGTIVKTPTEIGTYEVTAAFATNNQVYKIVDTFEITPRNYATHSGSAATETNKIEAKIGFENAETGEISDSTVYNTESQTPTVTIKDTLNDTVKTLVRGTDYELGYLDNDGNFVKVDAADDAATFGKTAAGTYKVYVQFKGNYMNKVEGVEGPVELTWHIVAAELTADDVTAPTALELTYNTENQYLVTPGSAGQIGTVYYSLTGAENDYSVVVPQGKDAGVYTVYWYVKGDSNHTDYTAANGANQITVTIAPKSITAAVELSDDTFTYDGTAKKFATVTVKDGDTVIDASEYELAYDNNTVAGEDTAKLTVSDAKTGKSAGADWTGNYTFDAVEKTFSIAKADPTITIAPNTITYDGAEVDQTDFTIVENNSDTDDIVLTFYADNNGEQGEALASAPVNAGTYWVAASVAETANYLAATSATVQFTIAQRNISGVTITVAEEDEPAADGVNPQVPVKFTVTDSEINKTLVSDTDFTAEFGNNVESGNVATIALTGKGNYTGTANGTYNVLATLDISEVKDLITSIEYNGEKTTENFEDNYNFRTDTTIKVVSRGVLKFGELTGVASEETNTGYIYELTIPAGSTTTKVTHIYNYATSQETDADSKVTTVYGVDNNVIGNTKKVEIVTLKMDDVYYLDDATSKITITDKEADGVTLGDAEYTYTKQAGENNTGTIVNGKPVNVGQYSVKIKINVTDGDGVEFVYVDIKFDVLQRKYDNKEVQVAITTDEYTYSAKDITPEIIVTDSKRADGEQTLIEGTDYTLSRDITKKDAGQYTIAVTFKGNYTGTESVEWTINPKDIASEDITFKYPRVSVLETTGWTKCDPIVGTDNGNGVELVAGTDYKVYRDTTNRVRDGLAVLIDGQGNYTGSTYLDWDVIDKPDVELTEVGVKDVANKKIWIRVNTSTDKTDAIAKTGVLVYKLSADKNAGDVTADNMTVENIDSLGLVRGFKAGTTYSPSVSNEDYGFVLRPYTELVGGTIVYGDLTTTSYAKIVSDATTASVELSEVGVKDIENKKIWIRVNTTSDNDAAIAKTGVLVYKLSDTKKASDVNAANMTIENKDALGLGNGSKPGTTYSPSVSNGGYGFVLRPYTEKIDGTVVYGDLVETSFAKVVSEAANTSVELSEYGVKDAADKKIWIRVNTTTDIEAAVARTGVLVYKLSDTKSASDVNAENMTLDNKELDFVSGFKVGTTYSPSVSNGDYGFVLRTYTELIDGSYVYGDLITTSYAEVAAK